MSFVRLHDKRQLENFFRSNPFLHLYELGDLDDSAWPDTTWYGLEQSGQLKAVVLLYTKYQPPVMIALSDAGPALSELLLSLAPVLPDCYQAHISPGLESALAASREVISPAPHYKMALLQADKPARIDTSEVIALTPADAQDALELYALSYPNGYFDAGRLESKPYFGIRGSEGLISIAGVHICSERYGVAALGDIATHPAHRGKGYAKAVTAALCQSLLPKIAHIGLNVRADNAGAINCYRSLGFEVIAEYIECTIAAKT
jgi:ribosomal protein S18 acetylase RimI-like enzyme